MIQDIIGLAKGRQLRGVATYYLRQQLKQM